MSRLTRFECSLGADAATLVVQHVKTPLLGLWEAALLESQTALLKIRSALKKLIFHAA